MLREDTRCRDPMSSRFSAKKSAVPAKWKVLIAPFINKEVLAYAGRRICLYLTGMGPCRI